MIPTFGGKPVSPYTDEMFTQCEEINDTQTCIQSYIAGTARCTDRTLNFTHTNKAIVCTFTTKPSDVPSGTDSCILFKYIRRNSWTYVAMFCLVICQAMWWSPSSLLSDDVMVPFQHHEKRHENCWAPGEFNWLHIVAPTTASIKSNDLWRQNATYRWSTEGVRTAAYCQTGLCRGHQWVAPTIWHWSQEYFFVYVSLDLQHKRSAMMGRYIQFNSILFNPAWLDSLNSSGDSDCSFHEYKLSLSDNGLITISFAN